ncbi:hypothetical protein DL95DRAFT_398200 [Leptodontidium sp. 2 PMI_412]|nr:hypothetical protein DL95DRAFT_398200 [Leptodontidium sp. 2 PMI_412]
MGAMYSDSGSNNAEWAANYFSEAQDLLGKLFDAISIETVQAALFMGCYAQHVIKPNLAYNYIGVAIRFAYSIGINAAAASSYPTRCHFQAALRTWWMLFGVEAEQCLDSGRPMSIRETDGKADFPQDPVASSPEPSRVTFITVLAKFSLIIRRVFDLVSSINEGQTEIQYSVGRLMNLQAELMDWRGSLPPHLRFHDGSLAADADKWEGISWVQRQRQSVQVHFNHVMLMMHRPFFAKSKVSTPYYDCTMSIAVCLGAARESIHLIHRLLVRDPSMGRWTYYCYYCLTATLILLMHIFDCPTEDARNSCINLCLKSEEVFSLIKSEPAQKCLILVQKVLHKAQQLRQNSPFDTVSQSTNSAPTHPIDIPFPNSDMTATGPSNDAVLPNNPSGAFLGDIFGNSYQDQPIGDFLRQHRDEVEW